MGGEIFFEGRQTINAEFAERFWIPRRSRLAARSGWDWGGAVLAQLKLRSSPDPRPAGENAGLRDDSFGSGVMFRQTAHYLGLGQSYWRGWLRKNDQIFASVPLTQVWPTPISRSKTTVAPSVQPVAI